MKYECKENDAVIELGKSKDELLIYINGENSKTVIGIKDLKEAMTNFNIDVTNNLCPVCKSNGFIMCSEAIKKEGDVKLVEALPTFIVSALSDDEIDVELERRSIVQYNDDEDNAPHWDEVKLYLARKMFKEGAKWANKR